MMTTSSSIDLLVEGRSSCPPLPRELALRVVGPAEVELLLPASLVEAEVPVRAALRAAPVAPRVGPHLRLQHPVLVRPVLDHLRALRLALLGPVRGPLHRASSCRRVRVHAIITR